MRCTIPCRPIVWLPLSAEEIDEIVDEGYDDQVREFHQAVADGRAFDGAASTPDEIERRLGLGGVVPVRPPGA